MPVFVHLQKRRLRRGNFLKQAGPPRENFAQAYAKKWKRGGLKGGPRLSTCRWEPPGRWAALFQKL